MSLTVDIYKGNTKLGTGTATNNSRSVTSYSGTAPISGRNVQIAITAAVSSAVGSSFATQVVTDGGATLTLYDICPFT